MESINRSAKSEFDNLLSQLVDALWEESELRSTTATHVELIEVKDRLHTLRSDLAIARRRLAPAMNQRADEITRPGSRRRSADELTRLTSPLRRRWIQAAFAGGSSRRR